MTHPDEAFAIQRMRELTTDVDDALRYNRLLICDRVWKWSAAVERRYLLGPEQSRTAQQLRGAFPRGDVPRYLIGIAIMRLTASGQPPRRWAVTTCSSPRGHLGRMPSRNDLLAQSGESAWITSSCSTKRA